MMSQNQEQNNDFDAFNSVAESKMDGSMMSHKNEDQNEFDAFNSMAE